MKGEIQVMLVDESERRADLRRQFAGGQLNVVGEAGFGPEAVTRAQELRPDVIVVSVEEPVARAFRTIESLTLALPDAPVIAASSLGDRETMRKAMRAGADDFLVKPLKSADQYESIAAVYSERQRKRQIADGEGRQIESGDIITIFGPKGGVGKTTLAVNIATAIALQTQQRVVLLDFDTQMGDIALLMNSVPDRTLADAVASVDRLEPELLQQLLWTDPSGVQVLPAPLRPEDSEGITGDAVAKILSVAARTFDHVVVDTGPHLGDATLVALDQSTLILLVTTPEWASLKRTKIALDLMMADGNLEDRIKLVINYAYAANGTSLADVEAALDYPIFWKVPWDPTTVECIKKGRPFVVARPAAKVSRNVVQLARSVCGLEATPRSPSSLFGWRRLVELLQPLRADQPPVEAEPPKTAEREPGRRAASRRRSYIPAEEVARGDAGA